MYLCTQRLIIVEMSKAFTEITRLSEKDCFYIVERHKTGFTYPLHQHKEFELNFIERGKGVRRIVGDSVEEIGDYELVLIGGEDLEHVWEQGRCKSKDIREITIQFLLVIHIVRLEVKVIQKVSLFWISRLVKHLFMKIHSLPNF